MKFTDWLMMREGLQDAPPATQDYGDTDIWRYNNEPDNSNKKHPGMEKHPATDGFARMTPAGIQTLPNSRNKTVRVSKHSDLRRAI